MKRTITANLRGFQRCYGVALSNGERGKGALHIRWLVDEAGEVALVHVDPDNAFGEELRQCVAECVTAIEFDNDAGKDAAAEYVFNFGGVVQKGAVTQGYSPSAGTHALEKALLEHRGEIETCYAQERKSNPIARGMVELHIKVAESGRVTKVTMPKDGINSASFRRCLTTKIQEWKFDGIGDPAEYVLPFDFTE